LLLPIAAVMQGVALGISSIVRPVITATLLGQESFGAIAGALALPVMLAMAFAPSLGAALWHVAGYDMTFGANVLIAVLAAAMLWLALARGPAPWAKNA
jgi:MFS family permease